MWRITYRDRDGFIGRITVDSELLRICEEHTMDQLGYMILQVEELKDPF